MVERLNGERLRFARGEFAERLWWRRDLGWGSRSDARLARPLKNPRRDMVTGFVVPVGLDAVVNAAVETLRRC